MREAGILLHITSLPGKYGCGSLGKCAYDFVDFLKRSNQHIWQILPIGPTSYGDSPYSALSNFGFNYYFIDLDLLVKDGLLDKEDLPKPFECKRVDFNSLTENRFKLFHKAYQKKDIYLDGFNEFKEKEAYWLHDYARFTVLKGMHDDKPWYMWYDDWKYRNNNSLMWLDNEKWYDIDFTKFVQYLFYKQFIDLRKYANKKGIMIMGDMPIYCAHDSSDVWAHPDNFQLNPDLTPKAVAGCPPDFFSPDGQLWGNPLYDWDKMRTNNYNFWVMRVKHSFELFDILRIDHFRGFEGYYSIPYGDDTAKYGHWETGPGYDLFKIINKECKNAKIVAENLGFLTPGVHKLLKKCGYPGMNIFQFELGNGKNAPIKKGFKENNIFYTGTHDNQTLMSFYNDLESKYKKLIDDVCDIKFNDKPNLKIIEYAMKTNCDTVIIPIQDYLGLSDDIGRMNAPSTISKSNWSYISRSYNYTKELSDYIKNITKMTNRG
ncbi:MAG: 4-alpha-glucanotransferase [Acholeplasmatales bacterium]|nr:4-alpha-glucanotransferase [Acholeplasmatales bacterium]